MVSKVTSSELLPGSTSCCACSEHESIVQLILLVIHLLASALCLTLLPPYIGKMGRALPGPLATIRSTCTCGSPDVSFAARPPPPLCALYLRILYSSTLCCFCCGVLDSRERALARERRRTQAHSLYSLVESKLSRGERCTSISNKQVTNIYIIYPNSKQVIRVDFLAVADQHSSNQEKHIL